MVTWDALEHSGPLVNIFCFLPAKAENLTIAEYMTMNILIMFVQFWSFFRSLASLDSSLYTKTSGVATLVALVLPRGPWSWWASTLPNWKPQVQRTLVE